MQGASLLCIGSNCEVLKLISDVFFSLSSIESYMKSRHAGMFQSGSNDQESMIILYREKPHNGPVLKKHSVR